MVKLLKQEEHKPILLFNDVANGINRLRYTTRIGSHHRDEPQ